MGTGKRLLVICDMFTPPAFLPRVRFFCDYLLQQGWQLDILTETPRESVELPYNIYNVSFSHGKRWEWRVKSLLNLFYDFKSQSIVHESKRLNQRYDAVFCSTFFSFPLPAAAKIARKQRIPLIVDLRDIPEQAPRFTYLEHRPNGLLGRCAMELYTRCNIRRRNKTLKQADIVTTVSPWHKEFLKRWNPQTQLIYNGYDAELFVPSRKKIEKFTISYTGKFYGLPLQDPTLFFESLSLLIKAQEIDAEKISLQWYMDEQSTRLIQRFMHEETLRNISTFHSLVPHTEIPTILNQSALSLVFSNRAKENGNHGIMTTKFFEALGSECPVLCVQSDEECLAQTISETRSGCAASNLDTCQAFLLERYQEWLCNGMTHANTPADIKTIYSRQYQAARLEELLLDCINKNKQNHL
ncbi:MAG: glycosyltransferase [Paludibacteraceae bacterium]|nr:glycosyltransferase [Paludibacteraceae bacterium]